MTMKAVVVLAGVLIAAPLAAQKPLPPGSDPSLKDGVLQWFTLEEGRPELGRMLGDPAYISDAGEDLAALQYQIDVEDKHDFSHFVTVRKSSNRIISVTRNYDPERTVDQWFPESETKVCWFPNAASRQWSVRVRRLPRGRVLMAMGVSKPGQKTGQLVLMRESELHIFYPWVAQELGIK